MSDGWQIEWGNDAGVQREIIIALTFSMKR